MDLLSAIFPLDSDDKPLRQNTSLGEVQHLLKPKLLSYCFLCRRSKPHKEISPEAPFCSKEKAFSSGDDQLYPGKRRKYPRKRHPVPRKKLSLPGIIGYIQGREVGSRSGSDYRYIFQNYVLDDRTSDFLATSNRIFTTLQVVSTIN